MKNFICCSMAFFLCATLLAEQFLLDRLIVEINGKSYSQKQLETYMLLRTIAMGEELNNAFPTAANWPEEVEQFKNEMVVYTQLENDQQKLDSFAPDSKKVQDAETALASLQSKNSQLDRFLRQRQLTEGDIAKILTSIFRIEGYTKSRQQLTAAKTQDDISFVRIDPNADWFQALSKATAFRFYAKAKEFGTLVPYKS